MQAMAGALPPKSIPRITGVPFPEWAAAIRGGPKCGSNFDYAAGLTEVVLLGVAARLEFQSGKCLAARLAVAGGYSLPQRLTRSEAVLGRNAVSEAVLAEAARVAGDGIELQDDTHATERYRRRILPALVERAIRQALATRAIHGD